MANMEHLDLLKGWIRQNVRPWNQWRQRNQDLNEIGCELLHSITGAFLPKLKLFFSQHSDSTR